MKVELVFDDWRQVGLPDSIYGTELGVRLSMGDLHSGTVFGATLVFDDERVAAELMEAFGLHGAYAVFSVTLGASDDREMCDPRRARRGTKGEDFNAESQRVEDAEGAERGGEA
jgi:hypothetical protein